MGAGGTQFDYRVTRIFAQKVAPYPIGSYVKLSNGFSGIVVENYPDSCMRPKIRCILDANNRLMMPRVVDLTFDRYARNVTIIDVLRDLPISKMTVE